MNTDFHALSKEALIEHINQSMKVIDNLSKEILTHKQTIADKEALLLWYRRYLFGNRSERHLLSSPSGDDKQIPFPFIVEAPESPPPAATTVAQYERKHRVKKEVEFVESDSRLQFDATVPVEEIELPSPVAADDEEAMCIGEKVTYRLGNNVQVPMSS
jgi:hypothetical protein